MKIHNAIAHKLIKKRKTQGASVTPSDAEIEKDEAFHQLFSNVLESYNSRCSRLSGIFEDDTENYRFSVNLKSHLEEEKTFLDFTLASMERLRKIIENVLFAGGGYLLFVIYEHNNRSMLLVAKLNHEEGAIFSEDMHKVIPSPYLNLERLQVAARVDLEAWKSDSDRYLTFVMKKDQGNPSDYFKEFLGAAINHDSKIESKKLVIALKDFVTKLLEEEKIKPEDGPSIQRRAFEYAEEVRKNPELDFNFETLSNAVWPEDPEALIKHINEHPESPSSGFIPDRGEFKKLSNISYKSRDLNVNMTYEFKQEHIVTEGKRIIINNAPDRLIEELTKGH